MANILVADDEPGVRRTVKRVLSLSGHEILEADDGAAAMSLMQEHEGAVDLLLADIKMPVMDGIALALSVAAQWPDIPILLMTGYADQRERTSGLENLIQGVIAKPFSIDQLQKAVAACLQGSQPRAPAP